MRTRIADVLMPWIWGADLIRIDDLMSWDLMSWDLLHSQIVDSDRWSPGYDSAARGRQKAAAATP